MTANKEIFALPLALAGALFATVFGFGQEPSSDQWDCVSRGSGRMQCQSREATAAPMLLDTEQWDCNWNGTTGITDCISRVKAAQKVDPHGKCLGWSSGRSLVLGGPAPTKSPGDC